VLRPYKDVSQSNLLDLADTVQQVTGLDDELTVLIEEFAVDVNGAVITHVADHVPMDGAAVVTAGFRVTHADCHMNRAANFLIKENVAREAIDTEIRADGKLAKIARACIGV
jgi:hypothetical protein